MNNRPGAWSQVRFPILAYSFLTLLIFAALYATRSLDDNRLTSWQWVFVHADPVRIALLIAGGLVISFFVARTTFSVPYPAVLLFVLSFGIAACFWGEPEVIVDASRYFTQAKHLEQYGISFFLREWGRQIPVWTDLPLLPFLYGLIFKIFGESRFWIQLFTTTLFSLTAVGTYLLGRTLWDRETGIAGGLFLLAAPYLFTQAPLMLVDIGASCFFLFAVLAVTQGLLRGGVPLLTLASCSVVFAILTKYSVWLMLSVLGVVFFVFLVREPSGDGFRGENMGERRMIALRGILIATGVVLLLGVVYSWLGDVVLEQIRLLQSYQRPGLRRWGESFLSTFLFQVHPIVTAAALFSLFAAFKSRDLRYAVVVWTVFLMLVLRIERIRYLIIVFPMLSLMAARGIREIEDGTVRRFVVLSAITSSIIVSLFAFLPFLKTFSIANLKEAGRYLDRIDAKSVEVITLPDSHRSLNTAIFVPILDLYTKKVILYLYAPAAFPPPRDVRISELRFTWEYRNPRYYSPSGSTAPDRPEAIAVINNSYNRSLPQDLRKTLTGFHLSATFRADERIFRSKSFVDVYERNGQRSQ